jgi:NAD(P)-dependent dehydrogenase (short-subunit alcohol dehydrogenase family)
MSRLAGKVALVVGAGASGPGMSIGRAVAIEFARQGAGIAALDIDLRSAEETAAIIAETGAKALALGGDASDPDAMEQAVARCLDRFRHLDVLHNNVGIMAFGDPVTLSLEDWDRVTAVNGRATFLAIKYAVPHLETTKGAIVNVSSIAAIRSTGAPYAAYSASKAAVLGLTRALAIEYAPRGIRVNCVVPGFIDSPMMRDGIAKRFGRDKVAGIVAERAGHLPLGRLGTPQDVARACAFLASDDAAYITGAELVVDGGVTVACRN